MGGEKKKQKKRTLQYFRATSLRQSFNANSLNTLKAGFRKTTVVEKLLEETVKAGDRELETHPRGYALASNVLMKKINGDALAFSLAGAKHMSLEEVLYYSADEKIRDSTRSSIVNSPNTNCVVSLNDGVLEVLEFPRRASFIGRQSVIKSKHKSTGSHRSAGSRISTPQPLNDGPGGGLIKTLSLPLSHIYSVFYPARTTEFELVFNYPNQFEDEIDEPTKDFKQISVTLKAATAEQAEKWVKYVLCAVQNQATYIDKLTDTLRKKEDLEGTWTVEDLLRLSVDMWTLVKGVRHVEVAKAQERLAEYLQEQGDKENEGLFWTDKAKEIKEVLSKEDITPSTVMEEILKDLDENGLEFAL